MVKRLHLALRCFPHHAYLPFSMCPLLHAIVPPYTRFIGLAVALDDQYDWVCLMGQWLFIGLMCRSAMTDISVAKVDTGGGGASDGKGVVFKGLCHRGTPQPFVILTGSDRGG